MSETNTGNGNEKIGETKELKPNEAAPALELATQQELKASRALGEAELIFGDAAVGVINKNTETAEPILEINENKERILTNIAKALCSKLEQILLVVKEKILINNENRNTHIRDSKHENEMTLFFAETAKSMWTKNDGRKYKPSFELSQISEQCENYQVIFECFAPGGGTRSTSVANADKVVLKINLGKVFNAHTETEYNLGVQDAFVTIHHETEHLEYIGTNCDGANALSEASEEQVAQYLGHPGEMRAFAKGMAFLYSTHFPGEIFDLEKMKSISSKTIGEYYFIKFSEPDTQKKFVKYHIDTFIIFEQMKRLTTLFVKIIN